MNIFDFLFLVLVLATLITLCTAGGFALAGRGAHSLHILCRLGIAAAVYFAVIIVVSLVMPRRVFNTGDDQCFDDWCIAVTSYRFSVPAGNAYLVNLRISSRAKRISQRERNIVVYLTDRDNRRYDPEPGPSDVPIHTLLGPGEMVELSRLFRLPPGARDLDLVIHHEGGFPIGWLIIGYDTWFRKPPLVRLNRAAPL